MLNLNTVLSAMMLVLATMLPVWASEGAASKPDASAAVTILKDGNARFVSGQSNHPHTDSARLIQAGSENQGDHAFATIITCSDSRIPVERIFDVGVMDVFIVRVAGNVCDTDENGSIEYGLCHVNTPVLVVLGHTQCGAVAAVTAAVEGHGHALERNIPALVDNIKPAVRRASEKHPDLHGKDLATVAEEENVWQSIQDLFRESPATRQLVSEGKAKVLGAIYEVGTGKVRWLDEAKTDQILAKVEVDPNRATEALAAIGDNDETKTAEVHPDH